MAVRLADYYKGHVRRVAYVCIGLVVAVNLTLVLLLLINDFAIFDLLVYILIPVVLLQVFSVIIILRYALEPLEIMSRAIAHVSNETNDVTPPAINEPRHTKSGLKQMVHTIYERSAANLPTETQAYSMSQEVIEQFPCGIIALDETQTIIYANSKAPVTTDANNQQHIELIFSQDDTLEGWLADNVTNKVSADHLWTRIENRTPGSDGRRLFDIAAHYQKGGANGIDTIILTLDRTSNYGIDEDDMDFIALAAHELRGPITVIRGYLDVLIHELEPTLHGDQQELLDRLSVSASRLSGYVGNILNVSRYDRRHLELHLREDKLDHVYATIADDLQLRARTQNRLLSVTIPTDLPTIAADRNSLSEVLANLVDNAIKYSNEGGQIVVTATVEGNFVTCSVQDYGIGIPSSVVGNLFSKFYRSHRSKQTVAGTGLGLYISKAIIESHGGQIGVRSTEGQGSLFSFSVPIYSTVADKLVASDNTNKGIIESSSGWIKNHSMFRG